MDKTVFSMALMRLFSGSIEMAAAIIMLKFNNVQKALIVNSMLALFGPFVLIFTTTIGLISIADKLSPSKLLLIIIGVSCLLVGILKK